MRLNDALPVHPGVKLVIALLTGLLVAVLWCVSLPAAWVRELWWRWK